MQLKEYIAQNLNQEQTAAALHTDTSSLIIAGAWSWKTRVLTYKIAYLIWGLNIRPKRILGVTFTNKAANEMKERLIKLWEEINAQNFSDDNLSIEEKKGEESDSGFWDFFQSVETKKLPQISLDARQLKRIGTFHSIFLKILKEDIEHLGKKYTKDFAILDADDSAKIVRDLLKRFALTDTFKPKEVKGFISKKKN